MVCESMVCSGTIVCVYLCVSTCVFVYVAQRYLLAYVCLYARVLDGMRVDGMLWYNGKGIAAVTTITPLVTLMQIDHNDHASNRYDDDDDDDDEHE